MIELVCVFVTSFISLFIYNNYFNKKTNNIMNLIYYYFISVLINVFLMYVLLYFVLNRNDLTFTVLFTIKYLMLSSFIALNIPIIFNLIGKKIDSFIKLYIKKSREFIKVLKQKYCNFFDSFLGKKILLFVNFIKLNKWSVCKNLLFILGVFLYFLLLDLSLRNIVYDDIHFYLPSETIPNLLTFAYSILIGTILIILPKLISKIFFSIISVFLLILFIVNYFMINIKSDAFSFYNLQIANEGLEYVSFIFEVINFKFIFILLLFILIFIFLFRKIKNINCNIKIRYKFLLFLVSVLLFILIRFYSYGLEEYGQQDGYHDINYPKYYVENMVNSRKNLSILGLYDYTTKDFFNYVKSKFEKFGSVEEIDEIIKSSSKNDSKNDYTGIFKDKNLIMIMMESVDNVVVDKKSMPTLSMMKENGWDFSRRYSQLNHGGSTIATEYTTLSGLWYLSDDKYDINNYPYSIPNFFKENNYIVTSFHENHGVYYNRNQLHKSLGFDKSHFLLDMDLDEYKYYDDEQLFSNDELYDLIIPKNSKKPFFSFGITISPHGPYKNNGICDENDISDENKCFRYLVKRTDDMLDTMLARLEEDGILDDTVILLYSDHPAYTYNYTDEELENTYEKIGDAYDIKNLPFVIYSTDIKKQKFDDIIVNDVDFAPTILNLFGMEYDSRYFVGSDLFSKNHKNVAMFNDYSWYDGEKYSGTAEHDNYYQETSNYVKERIDFSKMLVSNNYYKNIDTEERK